MKQKGVENKLTKQTILHITQHRKLKTGHTPGKTKDYISLDWNLFI